MTCSVELVFRCLSQITIITATANPTAMMEPITMPAIVPADRALLFIILLGILVGIGLVAGLVSLAYSAHDGFLKVVLKEIVAQCRLRKVS